MNQTRRKQLSALLIEIDQLKEQLEGIRDEEQESFDNMPQGLQQSERGSNSEAAINLLEQAIDGLDNANESITEITQQ
jgi:hypothetical protein